MYVSPDSRFASWKYVEMGVFKEWEDKETGAPMKALVRHRKYKSDEPIFYEWGDEVERYRQRYNNVGVYSSFFRYNEKDVDASRLGSLLFDLDSDEPSASLKDLQKLYSYITETIPEEFIRVYFTGEKGFHLEVEAIALGISPGYDLQKTFRFIGESLGERLSLPTLDFSVYDSRRMWRLPNSQHQNTGLFKVELDKAEVFAPLDYIMKVAEEPREEMDHQCSFHVPSNEWYREWVTYYEEEQERMREEAAARRQEMFNRYGTSIAKGKSKRYIDKVWNGALDAIREAAEKKEAGDESVSRNTTLSRQAFKLYILFLEEGLDEELITTSLYDIGVSVGLTERETKMTLQSALRAANKQLEQELVNG